MAERPITRADFEGLLRDWLDALPPAQSRSEAAKLAGFIAARMALTGDRREAAMVFYALGDQIVGSGEPGDGP